MARGPVPKRPSICGKENAHNKRSLFQVYSVFIEGKTTRASLYLTRDIVVDFTLAWSLFFCIDCFSLGRLAVFLLLGKYCEIHFRYIWRVTTLICFDQFIFMSKYSPSPLALGGLDCVDRFGCLRSL